MCVLRAVELAPTPGGPLNKWHLPCPVLTALLSCCRLMLMASFTESIRLIFSSSFPAAFYFPQHNCLSQRTLPSHDVPEESISTCKSTKNLLIHQYVLLWGNTNMCDNIAYAIMRSVFFLLHNERPRVPTGSWLQPWLLKSWTNRSSADTYAWSLNTNDSWTMWKTFWTSVLLLQKCWEYDTRFVMLTWDQIQEL